MTVLIRDANERDCKAICGLNRLSLGYDFDPDKTAKRLKYILGKTDNKILVAEVENEVAGYIHAADYDCIYSESLKNVLALAVDEERRGLGVGRRLLAAAEEWAVDSGAAGVRLVSSFGREGAHKFYHACGYTHRKDQKNFVKLFSGGGSDA